MTKILIAGPNSFFAKNFLKILIKEKIEIYFLTRTKKDFLIIKKKYKLKSNNYILISDVLNSKNKIKFNFIINFIGKYEDKNEPYEIFYSNVILPLKLFKYSIASKSQFFINIDTILIKKYNFYALTKGIFRKIMFSSITKSKTKIINLRFHNFFTFKKNHKNLISRIIKSSINNEIFFFTKGEQKREFLHIDDASSLLIMILKNKNKFNKNLYNFNIGSNQQLSIKFIANNLRKKFNSSVKLNVFKNKFISEYQKNNYKSDNIIKKYINWKPKYSLKKFLT